MAKDKIEEKGPSGRIGITLVDPTTDEEFKGFTRRITPALRDEVMPIIERDKAERERVREKNRHWSEFEKIGKAKGESASCPHCGETVSKTGAQLQTDYYIEHQADIETESEAVTQAAKEMNIRFATEMMQTIIDPDHKILDEGRPDNAEERREWLRSNFDSEFWREQPIAEVDQCVRKFRAIAQC